MSLSALLRRPPRWSEPAVAPSAGLNSAISRVLARWPDVVPEPPERDREALLLQMKQRLASGDWTGIHTSFVLAAATAAFDETRRGRPDLEELRNFYAKEVMASQSATFLGGMASVYFGSYVPGASHTQLLARALKASRDRIGARWRDLFHRLPDCLDPNYAADSIAKLMVNMTDPWSELKRLGIRLPHAPGLMDYAHLSYVKLLRPRLKEKRGVETLFAWLRPAGQSAKVGGAAEAITALLSNWLDRDPPADLLSDITRFLVTSYRDPRVSPGGAWAGVAPSTLAVVMRWLTGENIRFFLDTVTAVEDSHMWEPRRRFWLGLFEQGRVFAAWVAFSEEAENYARQRLSRSGKERALSFGIQTARGMRLNTSLLVMDLGSKIVVEGSHSYKVHIFRKGSERTPALYLDEYDCEQIRLIPDRPQGFHEARSHVSGWESWVLERI